MSEFSPYAQSPDVATAGEMKASSDFYSDEGAAPKGPAQAWTGDGGAAFNYLQSEASSPIEEAEQDRQSTLDGEPYPDWLHREVYTPLGLSAPILEPDVSGIQVGSSFAFLTARDWARVGQWWLDALHGRDTRLPQVWQRLAVTPGEGTGGANYGLGFWLNTGQRIFPQLPANTFHAGGNSGQFVVVIPERELVVVRLGLTLDESRAALGPILADLHAWAGRHASKTP